VLQTYADILKLHAQIDECVYERDELRDKTLPLQAQDNRLRALYKEENWKLREFDEWIARQDPDWQPPPRLPHGRKKRNKRIRELAREEAVKRRQMLAEDGQVEDSNGGGSRTAESSGEHDSHSDTQSKRTYPTLA
jgi:hypothetical protein